MSQHVCPSMSCPCKTSVAFFNRFAPIPCYTVQCQPITSAISLYQREDIDIPLTLDFPYDIPLDTIDFSLNTYILNYDPNYPGRIYINQAGIYNIGFYGDFYKFLAC